MDTSIKLSFAPVVGGKLTGIPLWYQKIHIETPFGSYVALGRGDYSTDYWIVESIRKLS